MPAHFPQQPLTYQTGFGNQFSSEALPDALPSARTRRRSIRWAFTPSSCLAPRSRYRVTKRDAAGSIASSRLPRILPINA